MEVQCTVFVEVTLAFFKPFSAYSNFQDLSLLTNSNLMGKAHLTWTSCERNWTLRLTNLTCPGFKPKVATSTFSTISKIRLFSSLTFTSLRVFLLLVCLCLSFAYVCHCMPDSKLNMNFFQKMAFLLPYFGTKCPCRPFSQNGSAGLNSPSPLQNWVRYL